MDFSFLMDLSGTQMAYLFVVVFLFVLAIIDLWVGVSNDAVNFIGSAVGARAAKLKHVMMVAAAGVFIGAAFSNGMMEVARSGIFNPSGFAFSEVMVIFLAVMVSDVFLLDLFNDHQKLFLRHCGVILGLEHLGDELFNKRKNVGYRHKDVDQ